MKKIILSISALSVILFTGCSEKNEVVSVDTTKTQEVVNQDALLKKVKFGFDEYTLVQKEKDVAVTNAEILKSFDYFVVVSTLLLSAQHSLVFSVQTGLLSPKDTIVTLVFTPFDTNTSLTEFALFKPKA